MKEDMDEINIEYPKSAMLEVKVSARTRGLPAIRKLENNRIPRISKAKAEILHAHKVANPFFRGLLKTMEDPLLLKDMSLTLKERNDAAARFNKTSGSDITSTFPIPSPDAWTVNISRP